MIQKMIFLRRFRGQDGFRILPVFWVLGGGLLLTCSSAAASPATSIRIGYVNLSLLLREMPETALAERSLSQELSGQKKLLLKLLAEIRKQKLATKTRSANISFLQRMKNEQRLDVLRQRYRAAEQQYEEDFSLARNQALVNLQRLAIRAIQKYGRQHHYTVILGQEVFFASPAIDLTSKVLAQLRLKLSKSNEHG